MKKNRIVWVVLAVALILLIFSLITGLMRGHWDDSSVPETPSPVTASPASPDETGTDVTTVPEGYCTDNPGSSDDTNKPETRTDNPGSSDDVTRTLPVPLVPETKAAETQIGRIADPHNPSESMEVPFYEVQNPEKADESIFVPFLPVVNPIKPDETVYVPFFPVVSPEKADETVYAPYYAIPDPEEPEETKYVPHIFVPGIEKAEETQLVPYIPITDPEKPEETRYVPVVPIKDPEKDEETVYVPYLPVIDPENPEETVYVPHLPVINPQNPEETIYLPFIPEKNPEHPEETTYIPYYPPEPPETSSPEITGVPYSPVSTSPATEPDPPVTNTPGTTQASPVTNTPITTQKPPVTTTPVTTVPKPPVTAPVVTTSGGNRTPGEPVIPVIPESVPSGTAEKRAKNAVIDYSNASDGYVMVKYLASTTANVKVTLDAPDMSYTFNIKPLEWYTLPLARGNGTYKVSVMVALSGSRYATVVSETINAVLTDETAPFRISNIYLNFDEDSIMTHTAAEAVAAAGAKTDVEKIAAIYNWIIDNIQYADELLSTIDSSYIPDLDRIITTRRGICYDFGALMCAMCRAQAIPCRMVHGYADGSYHAWVIVYSKDSGRVDKWTYINANVWTRMDPTFAATGGRNDFTMAMINDDSIYIPKFVY